MQTRIKMTDGSSYLIKSMPDTDCLDLRSAFEDDEQGRTLTVTMDPGGIVVLSRYHVVAIEFDEEVQR